MTCLPEGGSDPRGAGSTSQGEVQRDRQALGREGHQGVTTLVYGIKAKGKAKKRKQKGEKVMAAGRAVNGDPVEILRGIKELAARAGGIRPLKEFVDLQAE